MVQRRFNLPRFSAIPLLHLRRFIHGLPVIVLLAGIPASRADVTLPKIIGDHMVLQRGMKAPIRGEATPGEKVRIQGDWQRKAITVVADKNGHWMTKIPTPAPGGPHSITIKGQNEIVLHDVLIGEVWVCSGQSNMEMPVGYHDSAVYKGVDHWQEELKHADIPDIRLLTVSNDFALSPRWDCDARWVVCNAETAKAFSAVGFFFGRELHEKLNVPIGLVDADYGGTVCEAWTSEQALRAIPDFTNALDLLAQERDRSNEVAQANAKKVVNINSPSVLFNAMINPLIPFGIRGAIWYQGESNVGRAEQYRRLFPAMIADWRRHWGEGNFPFYYVQIAPFHYGNRGPAAALREAQLLSMKTPNTGMAVAMDSDSHKIHPENKQGVGHRLALWALAKTYGQTGFVYSGPLYKRMKIEGDRVRIFFDYAGSGLTSNGKPVEHFTIAGAEGKFVPALAEIDDSTIVVSSPEVSQPKAVRYAWGEADESSFGNKEGLPASSFRTDEPKGNTTN